MRPPDSVPVASNPGRNLEDLPPIERVEAHDIHPGDLIVIAVTGPLSMEGHVQFRQAVVAPIEQAFHDNPVVLLEGGTTIRSYRPAAGPQLAGDFLRPHTTGHNATGGNLPPDPQWADRLDRIIASLAAHYRHAGHRRAEACLNAGQPGRDGVLTWLHKWDSGAVNEADVGELVMYVRFLLGVDPSQKDPTP